MFKQSVCKYSGTFSLHVFMLFALLAPNNSIAQQATLTGNVLTLPVVAIADQAFRVELSIVDGTDPLQLAVLSGEELTAADTNGASTFDGVTLSIPAIAVGETIFWANFTLLSDDPITFVLAAGGPVALDPSDPPPASCQRPDPDLSNGPNNPTLFGEFAVDPNKIFDGGPGPDGIAPLEAPVFTQNFNVFSVAPGELVVGIKIGDEVRAYPHVILDWHEIVNDQFVIDGQNQRVTLSYCPLTGSAMLWQAFMEPVDQTFGTSGFLYQSNLVLYDRDTRSLWSQMLEQAISGPQLLAIPDKLQVVETTWATWLQMYPETLLMTDQTGFASPYGTYPYGTFKTDNSLLFPVDNAFDGRLHRKTRVLGINVGTASKVYPIDTFSGSVEVLNDRVGSMDVIAVGSARQNFAVVFNRELEDCTTLDFTAVQNRLPVVMVDNEGTEWDVFGNAVSGPRSGTSLQKTNSYIAYWYAWTAFFPNADIQP